MTAPNRLNLWMAASQAERDNLDSEAGLSPGDFCLVEGVNLYVATLVDQDGSTWLPLAGVPTEGPFAVGARNEDGAAIQSVLVMTSVSYRAVLDLPPSSITLVSSSSLDWSTASLFIVASTVFGLTVSGASNALAPGDTAWWRGTYFLNY